MQYNSCTKVLRFARLIEPTASATLVKSTKPSGIIPNNAATVETTASANGVFVINNCLLNNNIPMGIMAIPIVLMIKLIESRSCDLCFLNVLASAMMVCA